MAQSRIFVANASTSLTRLSSEQKFLSCHDCIASEAANLGLVGLVNQCQISQFASILYALQWSCPVQEVLMDMSKPHSPLLRVVTAFAGLLVVLGLRQFIARVDGDIASSLVQHSPRETLIPFLSAKQRKSSLPS